MRISSVFRKSANHNYCPNVSSITPLPPWIQKSRKIINSHHRSLRHRKAVAGVDRVVEDTAACHRVGGLVAMDPEGFADSLQVDLVATDLADPVDSHHNHADTLLESLGYIRRKGADQNDKEVGRQTSLLAALEAFQKKVALAHIRNSVVDMTVGECQHDRRHQSEA